MKLTYRRDHAGNLQQQVGRHAAEDASRPLDRRDCQAVLARNVIGRLAVVRGGVPTILPVTYGLDTDGAIVFRSSRGTKRQVAEASPAVVAFEVDEYDPATGRGVAVLARGRLRPILDLGEIARLSRLDVPQPWPDEARRAGWLSLRVDELSGRTLPAVA